MFRTDTRKLTLLIFSPPHAEHPKVCGYNQRIKRMLKGKMQGLIYKAVRRTVGKGG